MDVDEIESVNSPTLLAIILSFSRKTSLAVVLISSVMAQHLLPASLVISPVVCWLILFGYRWQVYTAEMGITLLSILNVIIFVALVWRKAYSLCMIDNWPSRAEKALEQRYARISGMFSDQGELISQVKMIEDITKRKQTEEALRESEARFRAAAEGSLDAFFIFQSLRDETGRIIDFTFVDLNSRGEEMISKPKEEVIGKRMCELLPINRTGGFFEKYVRVVETKEVLEEEFAISTPKVKALWLHHQVVPLADGIAITSRDISDRKQALEALRLSEQRFRLAINNIPDTFVIYNAKRQLQFVNACGVRRSGLAEHQLVGHTDEEIFPPEVTSQYLPLLQHAMETRTVQSAEYTMTSPTAGTFTIVATYVPLLDESGEIYQILGITHDITKRKRAEEALQQANEQLTNWVKELEQRNREIALLSELSDILQACLSIEEAHSALAELVQPLFPDVSGGVFIISASKQLVEAVATWGDSSATSQKIFTPNECWALRRGRSHWAESTHEGLLCKHTHRDSSTTESLCVPMMAQGEALGVLYLRSQQKQQFTQAKQQLASAVAEHIALALANLKLHEALQQQSIRDPLTGLFNRRYLEESLERELNRASRKQQPLGIIMIDVDLFKQFNDSFGHEAGDTALRELGTFIIKQIRGADIACRYGGEEFILILPEASLNTTRERAEQIRQGAKHLALQNRHQHLDGITLSLGVAVFPEHGLTGESVIHAADAALYRAKSEGRDRTVVYTT